MSARNIFTTEQKTLIVNAIKEAELNTSGEIRVHIEKQCKGDVLDQAAFWFEKLEMHKTELRNGVLFYLAVEDHKFAILGDVGINQKVPEDFWESTKEVVLEKLKEGLYSDGLEEFSQNRDTPASRGCGTAGVHSQPRKRAGDGPVANIQFRWQLCVYLQWQ